VLNLIEGGLVVLLIIGIGYAGQWLETNKDRLNMKTQLKLKNAELKEKELNLKAEIVKFRTKELDRFVLPMRDINTEFKVLEAKECDNRR